MPRAYTPEEKKQAIEQKAASATMITGETSEGRPIRRKRGILNGTETKLKVGNLLDGFHMHWMNDRATRIEDALDAGYEFVTPTEVGGMQHNNVTDRNTELSENKVRVLVGTTPDGPLYAYLMKIRQEWYDEDQAALQETNNRIDEAIRGGTSSNVSSEGLYVPREGIKYKQ